MFNNERSCIDATHSTLTRAEKALEIPWVVQRQDPADGSWPSAGLKKGFRNAGF